MNIHDILINWMDITQKDDALLDYIDTELLKSQSLNQNDESNRLYLQKRILCAHFKYTNAISLLKKRAFYDAWVEFELIEIDLIIIKENIEYIQEASFYGAKFLARMVMNWQALYPYKVFFSSREIIKKAKCSICDKTRSFINDCGHIKNKIYNGNLCFDEVVDFEIITYDIVSNPVNKFSVAFLSDGDKNNYSSLINVIKNIESPHQIFRAEILKYKIKDHTGVISPESFCPCGAFKEYKKCCLKYDGIYDNRIYIWFPLPLDIEPF